MVSIPIGLVHDLTDPKTQITKLGDLIVLNGDFLDFRWILNPESDLPYKDPLTMELVTSVPDLLRFMLEEKPKDNEEIEEWLVESLGHNSLRVLF